MISVKCNEEIIEYMHEYLDEEITDEHKQLLKTHIEQCEECRMHFHELKRAIAFVQSTSHFQAPAGFTENVMARLPKEKKKVGAQRWLRKHPMLAAASLFLILMSGSVLSAWNQESALSVSKQSNLVIENDTVIVPEGEVVKGDVVVKNGNLQINGEVEGDATVINGEQYLASAGNVTGEIKEVDQLFEWLWYHIKNTSKSLISTVTQEDENE